MRFAIRVRPGAARTAVGGRYPGPGGDALIVSVSAPAVDGRANEAVRWALAEAFGVRGRDVVIVRGDRGRDKLVELAADPELIARVLTELLG